MNAFEVGATGDWTLERRGDVEVVLGQINGGKHLAKQFARLSFQTRANGRGGVAFKASAVDHQDARMVGVAVADVTRFRGVGTVLALTNGVGQFFMVAALRVWGGGSRGASRVNGA